MLFRSLISFLLFFALKRWLHKPFFSFSSIDSVRFSKFWKVALVLLMIFLIKCSVTLTLGSRFLITKHTVITGDNFLNGLVINPYYALSRTVREYKKRIGIEGLNDFIPTGDLRLALTKIYSEGPLHSTNIDDWIERTTKGSPLAQKPQHIFVVIMESQDNWLLQNDYSDFPVSSNLRELKEKGLYLGAFVSAGVSTINALDGILMGIPQVGVVSHYQTLTRKPLSTSIANQFKGLGYSTNFFYGGFLGWHRLGELASDQGFETVHGCVSMASRSEFRDWGIDDEDLFKFVIDKISNSDRPTFNVIMTTSNHPPHPVALEDKGCPIDEIEEVLAQRGCNGSSTARILGHSWYADKCVGDFVKEMEKVCPNSLFAITGDHWGRHFIHDKLPTFETRTVPFILYGPEVLKDLSFPKSVAGTHVDMAPTLIDLIAPEGYKYCSLGRNLFDASERHITFGADCVLCPDCIFDTVRGNGIVEPLPWSSNISEKSPDELKDLYNAFHAIGWWMIMRGPEFGENTTHGES